MSLEKLLDPKYKTFNLFGDPFVVDIWKQRYKAENDKTIWDTFMRVALGVHVQDTPGSYERSMDAMRLGLFMPAGRILASAGIITKSTLQNCYVSGTIEDSMEGIHKSFAEAMTTLGRFGGIGMDFTPIRPKGAKIGTQGLKSPGVLQWMDMWHDGADRTKQAGHRRGAMMGVIADHHPDILDFIEAKQTAGRLTNFNVSILISDRFMQAVKNGGRWDLWHTAARTSGHEKTMWADGTSGYHYDQVNARDLWDKIMRGTYEFAEPGVIFIDKMNKENNLWYCEDIRCTNPCGEQPLPPYGACNLGHVNLALMCKDPFGSRPEINWQLLNEVVHIAVRFLDNVIDVSEFPLIEQQMEQVNKRRIGLGVSGLGDLLIQLGVRYGSDEAIMLTEQIMERIATCAYRASINLAKERGNFPLFDSTKYGLHGFAKKMKSILGGDTQHAMRNSLLLTVAPTGTTSIVFGNISSGIEPNFAFRMNRNVWVENNKTEQHYNESFISRFYKHCGGDKIEHQPYAIVANDVPVHEHIMMQAAVQKWIDASVTKTVNCPADIGFEEFKEVYMIAYDEGCKGCTTYRPSDVRGSVLMDADQSVHTVGNEHTAMGGKPIVVSLEVDMSKVKEAVNQAVDSIKDMITPPKRPEVLVGCTYKIKWPHLTDNVFLTINEHEGKPHEVFIASMDLRNIEWMVLNCIMLSRSLRRGDDPIELANMFMKIQGASEGAWMDGKYYTSLVSYIGKVLKTHFERYNDPGDIMFHKTPADLEGDLAARHKMSGGGNLAGSEAMRCPSCGGPTLIRQEGCDKCTNCGHTKCG